VEYLFLFAGLLAMDYYVWTNAVAELSQAYDHWAFAEELQGRTTSTAGFLRAELDSLKGRKASQARAAERASAKLPASTDRLKPLALIGTIAIPRLHLNLVVREGVNDETLRRAVGHIPSTALPGQFGNVALAAHRDTFFRPLRDIRRGDDITVQTLNGVYRYQVESIRIVPPQDTWVLNASSRPELTLVTCYPFYYVGSAPKRFIVRAVQIAADGRPAPRSS